MAQRGVTIDVPSVVEEPQLYLLARSGSSDGQQGMYNEERSIDLLTLQEKLTTLDGAMITDVLLFFHGDSPAAQFECGHIRAGHYIIVNPRRACTARVTVVWSVCLLSHISPMERLFILKTLSCTQRATKVKIFVGFSLKPLRCRDPALPPLCGRAYSRPLFLLKARMRIIVWASPRPLFSRPGV